MSSFPETLYVGQSGLVPCDENWEEIKRDPRGVLLMWSPPRKSARYIMGLDPTEGITGWSRATRTESDHKTDNGAIEIFEVDGYRELVWKEDEDGNRVPEIDPATGRQRIHYRDVQVAEFAAPCDAVEIARVANVLGRIYAGDEEDQCELIWEAWPGCGLLTTQELLRLGYGNLWHWEYIDNVAEETNRLGWRSSRESKKYLWSRTRRHLMLENAIIRSRFLLDEYSNAEIDIEKMTARAAYGYHDDRFMAANLAFWAGHAWSYDPERSYEEVRETREVTDYQNRAPGGISGDERTGWSLDPEAMDSFTDWRRRAIEEMSE
jgi:hypothetical protein